MKTEHLVERGLQAQVGADVEAAGDVVHGDRRDPGDEQPLHAAVLRTRLEGGEEVAIEAAAVGKRVVGVRPLVRQDRVGEVVVLVDQDVEPDAVPVGVQEQRVELVVDGRLRADALVCRFGEQLRVRFQRVGELDVTVVLEVPLESLQGVVEGGEVEPQHDVPAAVGRGVAADVRTVEQRLEVVGLVTVVVALHHRQPAGLAEPPRADEEHESLLLQRVQEARLVDVQAALPPDALEVGQPVWDGGDLRAFAGSAHRAEDMRTSYQTPVRGAEKHGARRSDP